MPKERIINNQTVYICGYGRDARGAQWYIREYNQILVELDIEGRLRKYIRSFKGAVFDRELSQFAKDAVGELSPIH